MNQTKSKWQNKWWNCHTSIISIYCIFNFLVNCNFWRRLQKADQYSSSPWQLRTGLKNVLEWQLVLMGRILGLNIWQPTSTSIPYTTVAALRMMQHVKPLALLDKWDPRSRNLGATLEKPVTFHPHLKALFRVPSSGIAIDWGGPPTYCLRIRAATSDNPWK